MQYRSAAYCRIAEINIIEEGWARALMYADKSLDYNAYNIIAYQAKAIALRKSGDKNSAGKTIQRLLEIDKLNHTARYEAYLTSPNTRTAMRPFTSSTKEPQNSFLLFFC